MKKILLAALATAAGLTNAPAENLLKNPSFEQAENGAPVSWVRSRVSPEQGIYSRTVARSGKCSVAIRDKLDPQGAGWFQEEYVQVEPGVRYRLSGWVKAENAWGGNTVAASLFTIENGKPKWQLTEYAAHVDGNKNWTQVTREFTIPEKVRVLKIAAIRRWKAPGTSYFDDLTLEKCSGSPTAAAAVDAAPKPDWEKALPAENFAPARPARRTAVAVDSPDWRKLEETAGELKRTSTALSIADTALQGVGWLSPAFPVKPTGLYGFETEVTLNKVYHVRLAAVFVDGRGQPAAIRIGPPLHGNEKATAHLLMFRPPAGAVAVRLALLQNRSGGGSSFGKVAFCEYP